MHMYWLLIVVALLAGCTHSSFETAEWKALVSGTDASLRGVCAPGNSVVWASGTGATVLRSVDNGETWKACPFPASTDADIRDIEAVDADVAWAMVITEPAQLWMTRNGGDDWTLVHEGREAAFFDSIARFENGSMVLFGDPINGVFDIAWSDDGVSWTAAAVVPEAGEGEAAFAASGTCVVTAGSRHAWIGTGGRKARVLRTSDGARTWSDSATPMRQGEETTGIYSVAFRDPLHGVIVGGDYTQPERAGDNAAITIDGGVTWQPSTAPPSGYRSCVVYVPGHSDHLVAVGRAGCDSSLDGGRTWQPLGNGDGYYAAAAAPDGTVFAVGSDGRIARLEQRPVK